jgi:hypothetical protein
VSTSGGAGGSGSPWSAVVTPPGALTAVVGTLYLLTAAFANATITLPLNPTPGQKVGVCRQQSGFTPTVAANAGQFINETIASITFPTTSVVNDPVMVFTAITATDWLLESSFQTDAGIAIRSSGVLSAQGTFAGHVTAVAALPYTVLTSDKEVNCTQAALGTITLPGNGFVGQEVTIVNNGVGVITVVAANAGSLTGTNTIAVGAGHKYVNTNNANNPIWVCMF